MNTDDLRNRLADVDDSIWKKITSIILGVILVTIGFAFHKRIGPDFWPLDQSTVGPNIIASVIQGVIVAIITILLWPPWRRRIHNFVDVKLDVLKAHHEQHTADVQELKDSHEQLHAKLDRLLDRLDG